MDPVVITRGLLVQFTTRAFDLVGSGRLTGCRVGGGKGVIPARQEARHEARRYRTTGTSLNNSFKIRLLGCVS